MPERANVLLIVSDQHNAQVMGHKGHPDVRTPNLDRLAGQGVRFDNAIAQSPICTPSRVSFLSGQYCHNHGYYGLGGRNPGKPGLPTIFGHFRRGGYRTAAIGKVHCPEYWVEEDCDFFLEAMAGCSIGGCPEYTEYLRGKGLAELRDDEQYPERPGPVQSIDARCSRLSYQDSVEAWIARQTIAFIRRQLAEDAPFFVMASLPRPHEIYCPSEPFWSMYDEGKLALPPNADYDLAAAGKAPHLRRTAEEHRKGEWAIFEPRTFQAGRLRKLHGYLGCVSQVDHAVGQMLDWLEEADLAARTIVIYLSDHGEYVCQHGIMEKAPGICADAVTRVPFIWRWPKRFPAGRACPEIVELVDLPGTLPGLAGLEPMQTSDGKDIAHLLDGRVGEVHRIGVTEGPWSKSVRKGKYRYVHYPLEMFAREHPDGFGELYDLEADPWEMRNLHFLPEYARIVCDLRTEMLDWLVTTTRPVTILPHVNFEGPQASVHYGNTTNPDGRIHPDWVRRTENRNYL
jgi:choline-sulfatase/uncharacterized sulfatase